MTDYSGDFPLFPDTDWTGKPYGEWVDGDTFAWDWLDDDECEPFP